MSWTAGFLLIEGIATVIYECTNNHSRDLVSEHATPVGAEQSWLTPVQSRLPGTSLVISWEFQRRITTGMDNQRQSGQQTGH